MISEALDERDPRNEVYSIYSDVYKEKYGTRPRHTDPREYNLDTLEAMLNDLYDVPPYVDDIDDRWDPYEDELAFPKQEPEETPPTSNIDPRDIFAEPFNKLPNKMGMSATKKETKPRYVRHTKNRL